MRRAAATCLLALAPALAGCLSHTHSVPKTHPPEVVQGATLKELLARTDERYEALNSMILTVEMSTSTGGGSNGEVKESISFSGYIIIGKPQSIHVILKLPILGSRALDMVSDGSEFKMLIPPRSCAIVGSDVVKVSTQKGLYALRPAAILDPLLIRGMQSDQVVSMTQDSRIVPDPKHRRELIEEPDYDLEFLSEPTDGVARSLRVIHISRTNLLPWRQDIYNADGKVETTALYSHYQRFGTIEFPTKIVIERPLDELSLTITITKASFNRPLAADEFRLDIPAGTAVMNVDDPSSARTAPCVAHGTQSPR